MKDNDKNDESKSCDVLGLKPFANSVEIVTKTVIHDASNFLNIICRPAAEEFGLLFKDHVRYLRVKNLSNILMKTKKIYDQHNDTSRRVSPRILNNILENGSWIDDDTVQEMWAGLLASSCTEDGKDESNLIFINLLNQLTSSEVKILNYACKNVEKGVGKYGTIKTSNILCVHINTLIDISMAKDVHVIRRELEHLNSLGLLQDYPSRFEDQKAPYIFEGGIRITPSSLALSMYVRCEGSLESPIEYFKLEW